MAIKGLGAAIAPKAPKEEEPESEESTGSTGKLAACEDMLSAFKRGDAKALMAALEDYNAMSSMPDDEDVEELDF